MGKLTIATSLRGHERVPLTVRFSCLNLWLAAAAKD
jgi:hypothetical protein